VWLFDHVQLAEKKSIMKNTLKVERAKLDWTQQQLADKVGVSRQTINSIEAERYVPSTVLALKIAKAFKTTVNEIFILERGD
jgi:putative transcriptional regulator